MRHLSVPKQDTQSFVTSLRSRGWYPKGYKILLDGECTLIPVDENAQLESCEEFSRTPIVELERELPETTTTWLPHLSKHVGEDVVNRYTGIWPNAQEHFGGLIIFKIDDQIQNFVQEIAFAKLEFSKKARLVLLDNGVEGEYRIRNLRPLAARHNGTIIGEKEIAKLKPKIQDQVLQTSEKITEYGASIIADPCKAYYSSRLANEREKTVSSATKLRMELGRPLYVADPYCGVGPAIIQLARKPQLVKDFLAVDINPGAAKLLQQNLDINQIATSKQFPVGQGDALTLKDNPELLGKFDILLMNLPHETIEHLPKLLPLLNQNNKTLLKGWVVLEESQIPNAENRIHEAIKEMKPSSHPKLEIRRQYNSTKVLTRFESWLG